MPIPKSTPQADWFLSVFRGKPPETGPEEDEKEKELEKQLHECNCYPCRCMRLAWFGIRNFQGPPRKLPEII